MDRSQAWMRHVHSFAHTHYCNYLPRDSGTGQRVDECDEGVEAERNESIVVLLAPSFQDRCFLNQNFGQDLRTPPYR